MKFLSQTQLSPRNEPERGHPARRSFALIEAWEDFQIPIAFPTAAARMAAFRGGARFAVNGPFELMAGCTFAKIEIASFGKTSYTNGYWRELNEML